MKKQIFIFMLALLAFQANAQKIHWLLFIDTQDPNVGQLDVNGRDYLKANFVDVVNSALSGVYQADIQDNYGSNCNPKKCQSAVQNLRCDANDIVVFYYIGHGGRSVRENDIEHPWPKMWLGQDDATKMIDLEWVHDQLKAKKPRLLLTIGMCCNVKQNLPTSRTPMFAAQSYGSLYIAPEQLECIKDAFTNTCGNLIATSAKPGQSSGGGTFNEQLGIKPMDYYTAFLCLNFHEMYEDQDIDLTRLFSITSEELDRETEHEQTPIFKSQLGNGECTQSTVTPPPPSARCREIPSSVNVSDMTDLENLMEAIVCNHSDMPNRSSYFDNNCIVRVIGQDGKTQVDRLTINNYILRIRTSSVLLRVVPVATAVEGGKIKELLVREYYKGRR